MSEPDDPYRAPSAPPADDRAAIAALFDRLRVRVLLLAWVVVLVMAIGSLGIAWLSRGRLLCLCLPIVPFLGVGAGWLSRLGLVLPDRHAFRVFVGPDSFDLEVDALRARIGWDEVAEAVHHEVAHELLSLFGVVGSTVIRLRTGETLGIPARSEGSHELVLRLRRRGLLRDEGERGRS